MKLGLIGPAEGAPESALRDAVELLLGALQADQAIYLGADDAARDLSKLWSDELAGGDTRDFLSVAAELAAHGSPDDIDALLERDRRLTRLRGLHALPPPPARGVEMVADRIMLMVHDKGVLDEEDIANSSIIVYGRAPKLLLKRFGPRYFFTPGPLSGNALGVVEATEEGRVTLRAISLEDASELMTEVVGGQKTKLTVTG